MMFKALALITATGAVMANAAPAVVSQFPFNLTFAVGGSDNTQLAAQIFFNPEGAIFLQGVNPKKASPIEVQFTGKSPNGKLFFNTLADGFLSEALVVNPNATAGTQAPVQLAGAPLPAEWGFNGNTLTHTPTPPEGIFMSCKQIIDDEFVTLLSWGVPGPKPGQFPKGCKNTTVTRIPNGS